MLFLSQPLGVGFSYSLEDVGTLNPSMDEFSSMNVIPLLTHGPSDGCFRERLICGCRWPVYLLLL